MTACCMKGAVVTWRMRAPEKKPLVHQERPENMHVAVHRSEPKKNIEPIKALSEFHDWTGATGSQLAFSLSIAYCR